MRWDVAKTLLFLFTLSALPKALAIEPPALQRWDRVVCLLSENRDKPGTQQSCSGFLISSEDQLFLVTADHAANETHSKTRLLYRDSEGKMKAISFETLFVTASNPWTRYKSSDLGIARLESSNPEVKELRGLAIPLTCFLKEAPPRTTKLEVSGFPLGLGVSDSLSPLVICGNLASTELTAESRWGREPVLYSTPAVAQGSSGGPAFIADDDFAKVTVAGMYIGVVFDATGAKLSKLVPSRMIYEAIQESLSQK
ncbi:MAG: trypsin-like peptidase domain-containing protein [Pirellulales bacterium]